MYLYIYYIIGSRDTNILKNQRCLLDKLTIL